MAVHVLILAHVAHWIIAGETVTPVEPSEAMETITSGRVNAGFIFFAVAIFATLILGRWLCGWGCHLVAYQDLTLWVLKKWKRRPKAFRSRLLLLAPLFAAFYMFFLPEVVRLWQGAPRPTTELHLKTTGFWDTFPQYGIAILTVLVCGVAMIHLLGPKGFCTYACPYGALFAIADKFAVGRIRVTDACHQCGHCTSVCTSNVKVAEEVKLYKMVVDPGCMKCMDCVTVCPNDALYFGFGKPSLGAQPVAPRKPIRWDMSWGEELLAAAVFVGAFLAYRGLYGLVPFLMSLGVAGVATYLIMKGVWLIYARDVLIQRVRLKAAGEIQPLGYLYAVFVVGLVLITAHCGVWRYHDYLGNLAFNRSPAEAFRWQYEPHLLGNMPDAQRQSVQAGIHHLEAARAWSLYAVPENDRELAWLYLQNGESDKAVARVRDALGAWGHVPAVWLHIGKIETARGDLAAAREALEKAIALDTADREPWDARHPDKPMAGTAGLYAEWGMFLAHCGEADKALASLQWAASYDVDSLPAQLALANFQLKLDRVDAARAALIAAARVAPGQGDVRAGLMAIAKTPQNFPQAIGQYEAAMKERPDVWLYHYGRAFALTELGRFDEAARAYRDAVEKFPGVIELRADYGAVLMVIGDSAGAAREYEHILDAQPANAEAALRLGVIHAMSGRRAEATRAFRAAMEHGDENQRNAARVSLEQLGESPKP